MTLYPNASLNAEDGAKHPSLSPQYQAQEIEFFIGDSASDSVCHFKDGNWIDLNLKNAEPEPVYQILIDDRWTYIEADGHVLLDKLGGYVLPPITQQKITQAIVKLSGVE